MHAEHRIEAPPNRRLSISYVDHTTLHLNPRNPRRHSRKQIRQLSESIRSFGMNVPILVDGKGAILAGEARFQACRDLGWTTIPVIYLEHLKEAQALAFMVAENRLSGLSEFEPRAVAEILRELSVLDLDFNLEATGFEMGEIDLLIEGLETGPDKEDPDDAVPEAKPPISRPGDRWILGRHAILCGNALEETSYQLLLQDRRAAMVFTDPPYNVPIDGHVSGLGAARHREFAMATGEMSRKEFQDFLTSICTLLTGNSMEGSLHFLCMDWRHMAELLGAAGSVYAELKNLCVWAKSNAGMGSLYRSQHELVFVYKHGRAPHRNNVQLGSFGRHRSNLWTYPGMTSFGRSGEEGDLLALHPTVKPVALVADAMLDASARGDLVLDPFLGSGTTLTAAERVGRCAFGLEIDPVYVDVAIRRWQRLTGDSAIHSESKRSFEEITAERSTEHVG